MMNFLVLFFNGMTFKADDVVYEVYEVTLTPMAPGINRIELMARSVTGLMTTVTFNHAISTDGLAPLRTLLGTEASQVAI